MLEVVELMCRVAGTGVEPDVRGTGTPPGEITRQWVDSTKLRTMSGLGAASESRGRAARTIEWYREYVHGRDGLLGAQDEQLALGQYHVGGRAKPLQSHR